MGEQKHDLVAVHPVLLGHTHPVLLPHTWYCWATHTRYCWVTHKHCCVIDMALLCDTDMAFNKTLSWDLDPMECLSGSGSHGKPHELSLRI